METVNMHEAKTHLSRLVAKAAKGEAFIIAIAGKPMVKVVPLDDEKPASRRLGFLADEKWTFPQDRQAFKDIGKEEIELMFGLEDEL